MLEQIDQWISGLSKFELWLLIYFYFLLLIWLWKSDSKLDNKKSGFFFRRSPQYQMAVDKKKFIQEVIRWGLTNMSYEGIEKMKNRSVNLEVSYYKHKKHYGTYYSFNKKIKVYVNTHSKIDELIDSSLHELCHHFQFCTDPKNFETRYKRLLDEYTYEKHPMEIEARSIASKYVKPCFNYLVENGFLKEAA
jgi:hypothetical protein